MKKLLLLSSLLWFVLNVAYAQIDPGIPTPPDLEVQNGITILTKQRLEDGTIVIRYRDKQGRTIQRRTHPSKPGEKQEWDEANPPQRPDLPNPGATAGHVPSDGPGAAAGGLRDTAIGGQIGEGYPGAKPGEAMPGKPTGPGGVPLGEVPSKVLPGGQAGELPPDKPNPKPGSPLDDVRKGAEGILPDNSTPGKPTSALGEAGKATKKFADEILKAITNLVITTTGTGQTIGVIANITLKNNNDFPVGILPQTFFIPSDGKYQSYVARIPDGTGILPESTYDSPGSEPNVITIPPGGTVVIPVTGVCADVYTPPVPSGQSMPPVSDWVPVGGLPPGIVVDVEPSGATYQVSPPGTSDPPSTAPTPTNPSDEGTPKGITLIPIVSTVPVPKFDPTDIPQITTTSGYTPVVPTDPEIIITWPGTDIPVGGVLDPRPDPETFAPVIVEVLEAIEEAVDVIQMHDSFPTPFGNNPSGERDAIIQQTFWIYTSTLTGRPYTKDDFTTNTYRQFENTTGKTVTALKPEQKEQVDEGITDFWNAFQATGVAAKVISAESNGIELEIPATIVQVDQMEQPSMTDNDGDGVADPNADDESIYNCTCPDTISFTLKVNRGNTAVLETANTILTTADTETKPREQEIKVDKLKFGDTLSVHVSTIDLNCQCANTSCDVVWSYMMNNTYCNNIDPVGDKLLRNKITFKTSPKNKKDAAIVCFFFIHARCTASGCKSCDCYYSMKLTFVDSKSKK